MRMDFHRRVETKKQLLEYFHLGIKNPTERMIGMEYERAPVFTATGEALPFDGEQGIERMLFLMAERFGWTPMQEKNRVIGLARAGSTVTLEPGSQFEFSSAKHHNLCDLCHAVRQFLAECRQIEEELQISFLGIGLQPFTPLEKIPWIPKERYAVMREALPPKGDLAAVMMKQTAGIQTSLDFTSEEDAMAMLRLGMRLAPLATAIFANSPFTDGKPNGYKSFRGHVWRRTDPDRCGLLGWALRKETTFADYVDYALDVPLMFIIRDGEYIPTPRLTFRRFMTEGFEGHTPTFVDWETALSQLFPEVRMKHYIEFRSMDSQRPGLALAIPAFFQGLFYGENTRPVLEDLLGDHNHDELVALQEQACRFGLDGRWGRHKAKDLARKVLQLAKQGLTERGTVCHEIRYLDAIETLAAEGLTPADRLLKNWETIWKKDRRCLIDDATDLTAPVCAVKEG